MPVAARRLLGEASAVSGARFADGLRYRIEIPSVEGPGVFRAVLEEAEARGIDVRRISQGSGVMMLTDTEISEMAELGAEHGIEVSLFLGPRGAWDTGGQSLAAGSAGGVARGVAGIDACLSEVRRGVELGIRSFLVADVGVLATLGRMKRDGDLPESLVLAVGRQPIESTSLPKCSPDSIRASAFSASASGVTESSTGRQLASSSIRRSASKSRGLPSCVPYSDCCLK